MKDENRAASKPKNVVLKVQSVRQQATTEFKPKTKAINDKEGGDE